MKKLILFIVLGLFFFPNINFGCSCMSPSSFCESITDETGNLYPDVIVKGVVDKSSDGRVEIKVNDVIYGAINQSKFEISYGFCTLFLNEMVAKKEYVVALRSQGDQYFPLPCAIFFLEVDNNNIVKGKIAPGVRSISYGNLKKLKNCGDWESIFSLDNSIKVFPNPTSDKVKIMNIDTAFDLKNIELKIYDSIGRLYQYISNVEGILQDDVWTINIQDFPAGLYLFKMKSANRESTFKIVKQ